MIIDAHLHLDLNQEAPLSALLTQLDRNDIYRGVLILNTYVEQLIFKQEIEIYNENRLRVAFGLSPHDNQSIDSYSDICGSINHNQIMKIHPRIMKVTKNDFLEISHLIENLGMSTIVIDTLVYGPAYEYNVGIELGVYLAEKFPKCNIVLAHAGSTRMLECMMMTRWIENIYYDISFVNPYFIDTSVGIDMKYLLKRTANKVMFGSDFPSFSMEKAKTSLLGLCYEVALSTEEIEKILYGNASLVYDF